MKTKDLTICVLFSLFAVSLSTAPNWKVCDPKAQYEAKVTNVDVNAAVSDGVIQLKKGTNVTVSVSFKEGVNVNTATAVVHGIIDEVPIPFPIPNNKACTGCNLACPLKAAASYIYKAVIPVLHEYPDLRLVVKWQLNDDQSKKQIWCLEMPAQIVS